MNWRMWYELAGTGMIWRMYGMELYSGKDTQNLAHTSASHLISRLGVVVKSFTHPPFAIDK
jgi:hypothetical protein